MYPQPGFGAYAPPPQPGPVPVQHFPGMLPGGHGPPVMQPGGYAASPAPYPGHGGGMAHGGAGGGMPRTGLGGGAVGHQHPGQGGALGNQHSGQGVAAGHQHSGGSPHGALGAPGMQGSPAMMPNAGVVAGTGGFDNRHAHQAQAVNGARGHAPQSPDLVSSASSTSSTTSHDRLHVNSEAKRRIVAIMNSKENLRKFADKPFKNPQLQGRTELNRAEFKHAVTHCMQELGVKLPDDNQLNKMFDKHRRIEQDVRGGVSQEKFEALIFRSLSFMLATEEVTVDGRQGPSDAAVREDFLRKNDRKIEEVYSFGKKLGEGSFGSVYLVSHRTESQGNSKRSRVCKIISKKLADQHGTSYERVREEFEVLKKLDHPHVLRIFESFEDAKNFYIIMEPARGGDLQDAVTTPQTSDAREWEIWCARVMSQTLGAIAYCHQRGVIHKDLKPENVMLANEKNAKLSEAHVVVVDFGLAEVFSPGSHESLKEIAGTPPFMAPEVWTGKFNRSCDIWSCGCMLFFMLSGRLPFMAERLEDWYNMVKYNEPHWSMIGGATEGAQNMCWRMLTKADTQRPSAQTLLTDPRYNSWFVKCGLETGNPQSALPRAVSREHYDGLMHVGARSNFEKFVTRLVATQLDSGQQTKVNEAFKAFDRDGDGHIGRNELEQGLMMLGAPPDKARQVAKELDVSNTGKISYSEFMAGVMDIRKKDPKEQETLLKVAWQQFCPDKRGVVTVASIQDALSARGMTVAELPKEFLQALHKGEKGELTYEDFKKAMAIDSSRLIMQSLCAIPKA